MSLYYYVFGLEMIELQCRLKVLVSFIASFFIHMCMNNTQFRECAGM